MAHYSPKSRYAKDEGGNSPGRLVMWLLTRVGIPLAVVYGIIWWRVDSGVQALVDQAGAVANIRRGSSYFELNGDVGVKRLVITPKGSVGKPVRIEKLALHTPGLWWLIKTSVFRAEVKELPQRMGLTLTNFDTEAFDDLNDEMPFGIYSGALMETMGCGKFMWKRADLRAMGLKPGDSTMSVTMEPLGSDGVDVHVRLGTEHVGSVEAFVQMAAPGAVANPRMMPSATLTSLSWTFHDEGFIAARNTYCGKELGVSPQQFVDKHMDAIRAELRQYGMQADAPLEASYRGYASNGGELVIRARPPTGLSVVSAQGRNFMQMRDLLSPVVEVAGHEPVRLAFTPIAAEAPVEQAVAAPPPTPPPVAAVVTAVASAAAPVATPAPAPAKAPAKNSGAAEPKTETRVVEPVSYEQLKDKVGREVVVITTLGTRRRGTLLKISNSAVIVKLDAKAGGIELDIPRDTVRSVELISVPVAVPEAETQTGVDSAKKK